MSTLLSSKASGHPFICGVLLATNAIALPVHGNGGFQPFFDSLFVEENFIPLYNSAGKVTFTETGKETTGGILYTQTLSMRFPNGDLQKATRVSEILKATFFAIALTTGRFLIIGRNDVYQNTSPVIETRSLVNTTEVTITVLSIFSAGYLYIEGNATFPFVIPSST